MKQKNHDRAASHQQQDLIDLPEEVPEKPWKQFIFTPKFIFLAVLASFFLGRNIYYEYTRVKAPAKENPQPAKQQPSVTPEIYDRFFWYMILSLFFLAVYIFLRRKNDIAQEERLRQQIRRQEEEDQKMKRIQTKANKIITSMDQFGNLVDEPRKFGQQPKVAQDNTLASDKKQN